MTILETRTDRLLLLIEQLKTSIRAKDSIENSVKKSADLYSEFNFLAGLSKKISQGAGLEQSVQEQIKEEKSGNIKIFLEALTAKELASQKLEELRIKITEEKKAESEKLLSIGTRIGMIAGVMFIPLLINYFSSLTEVFQIADINFTISDATKSVITIGCALIITYMMFSRRRKDG